MTSAPKHHLKKDKFFLQGKATAKEDLIIQQAVDQGLGIARESIGMWKPVLMRFWVSNAHNDLASRGWTTKHSTRIWIQKARLNSRKGVHYLTSTIIHEYVHWLRLAMHGFTTTVLDSIIEEGIAVYTQVQLGEPRLYPDYEPKALDAKTVRMYRSKFVEVFDEPLRKYPAVNTNVILAAAQYRYGYSVIRQYVKRQPKTTYHNLITLPVISFAALARRK